MAKDGEGKSVAFGDWVAVELERGSDTFNAVVRIVKLTETAKGVSAVGAFVELIGHGRVSKGAVDLSKSRLLMRSNGEVVS